MKIMKLSLLLCLLYTTPSIAKKLKSIELIDEDVKRDMKIKTDFGDENLVIIKTVSESQKSFVINQGAREGIAKNQKALFSTEEVSLMCKAIEVTHDYSLWKVVDKESVVPFKKREFVVYNNALETIWTKIPSLKDHLKKKIITQEKPPEPYWIFRWSLSQMLYEAVTDTASGSSSTRRGFQYEISRNWQLKRDLDFGLGIRYDNEVATIEESPIEPNLNVPTTRILGFSEFTYRFKYIKKTKNYWYASLGAGIGTSATEVDNTTLTGNSAILPSFRIGLKTDLSQKKSLLIEGVGESIASVESFKDGTEQRTNIINIKLSVGLKF